MEPNNFKYPFFYGSEKHDRVYNSTSFEYWIKKFFTTGVFAGELQVTANNNMTVTIGSGYINIGGKVKFYEQPQEIFLETAHPTYDRIDCIVIERNDSIRDFVAKVIPGGYSSNPLPKAPERENGIDQRVLAQIKVVHGAVKITQADVTDTRADPELCGIVAGTVKEMDFSQFQTQFDSYFSNYKEEVKEEFDVYTAEIQRLKADYLSLFLTWFEEMKDQLSEDAAGNIQNQIEVLKKLIDENKENVLDTKEEIEANTDTGKIAGALAVKEMFNEVNNNLEQQPTFIYDSEGKIIGYKTTGGADAVFPFKGTTKYKITITQFWNTGDLHMANCTIADEEGNLMFSGSSGWMKLSSQGSKSYNIEL